MIDSSKSNFFKLPKDPEKRNRESQAQMDPYKRPTQQTAISMTQTQKQYAPNLYEGGSSSFGNFYGSQKSKIDQYEYGTKSSK